MYVIDCSPCICVGVCVGVFARAHEIRIYVLSYVSDCARLLVDTCVGGCMHVSERDLCGFWCGFEYVYIHTYIHICMLL